MRKKIKQLDFTDVEENWVSHSIEGYYCLETEVRQLEDEHNELLGKTEELERKLKIAEEALKKSREDINWMLNSQKFLNPFVFDYIEKALKQIKGES